MQYFVHPSAQSHHWNEDCVLVPLHGHYDERRMHDTLCTLQSSLHQDLMRRYTDIWTRMVIVNPCTRHDGKTAKTLDGQLMQFGVWAHQKGCVATAVVMPEHLLESFLHIQALSEDAHNGVRVFFDQGIAEQWLIQQQQRHRRLKLH